MAALLQIIACWTVVLAIGLACGSPALCLPAGAQQGSGGAAGHAGPPTDLDEVYNAFNHFCKARFGGRHEPLVYETFGQKLRLDEKGTWSHVSENSATLAFSTNIPAVSHVEVTAEGQDVIQTEPTERAFYNHIHHVAGLKPGTTYDYQFIAVDEKGNREVLHTGRIAPAKIDGAIYVPGDVEGPPYNLTEADTTYVLTKDIVADAVGINVMARGITLDLNGCTVVYDNVAGAPLGPEKGFGYVGEQGAHGVRSAYSGRDSRIVNGRIVQGKGGSGAGSRPVTRAAELAGVSIDYYGTQVSAMAEVREIRHCSIRDRGTELTNRHSGVAAITGDKVRYNLVRRARHRGIVGRSGGAYHGNEVYVDSYATNSFGILFYKATDAACTGNKLFGTGYHALGVGTVSAGVADVEVIGNFIHLEAVGPLARSAEYGDQSQVECVRVTWGGENILYEHNVMIAKAQSGGEASGIWHFSHADGQKNVVYRNNVVKVLREDDRPTDRLEGAIRVCGTSARAERNVPVLIEGNRVISNFCNVRLGDRYGTGSNAQFVDNTFVRTGDQRNYATIVIGHGNATSIGHVFQGTKLEGGAGFDRVEFLGWGRREFTVVDDEGNRKVHQPPSAISLTSEVSPGSCERAKRGSIRSRLQSLRVCTSMQSVGSPRCSRCCGRTSWASWSASTSAAWRVWARWPAAAASVG